MLQIVDSLFQWALSHPTLTQESSLDEFEHISLKYISYLSKYRNNTYRAYFELKSLLGRSKNISLYFNILSKIISSRTEKQLNLVAQDHMGSGSSGNKDASSSAASQGAQLLQ